MVVIFNPIVVDFWLQIGAKFVEKHPELAIEIVRSLAVNPDEVTHAGVAECAEHARDLHQRLLAGVEEAAQREAIEQFKSVPPDQVN